MQNLSPVTVPLTPKNASKAVSLWLLIVTGFLVAMIVVGGATRLTDSGLSITEWKPVTGVIPPLGIEAWQAEFNKYKQIPEFKLQNSTMTLGGFKQIYYWEWGHRLLGRLIGLVVLVPMIVFAIKGQIRGKLAKRLFLLLGLGAVQGALGWWMVSSGLGGLDDRLDVSAYRLATHMGMALIILGIAFWTALEVRHSGTKEKQMADFGKLAIGFVILIWLQAILGAFVAGTDGGYVNNTWPLMDGGILPFSFNTLSPFWRNFFENPALAQFDHRLGAYLVLFSAFGLGVVVHRRQANSRLRQSVRMILTLVVMQVLLGIWTVLAVTPVPLGIAHQTLGVLVYLSAVRFAYLSR